MKPQVLFLVNPTAVGKTALSIAFAKKINAGTDNLLFCQPF